MTNILDSFRLNGKAAIVTGASRGLGQAMAIALAEAGADVVAADLTECAETLDRIHKLGAVAWLCMPMCPHRERRRN